MSDKKNIDRLFQERFKDFEATPSDAVWNNIEAKLQEKNKKRRVIPIWWRYAGVAALLLLLLTVGNNFFNDSPDIVPSDTSNTIVDTENATRSSVTQEEETISVASYNNSTENNVDAIDAENASENLVATNKTPIHEKTGSDNGESGDNSNSEKKSNSVIQTEKYNAIAKQSEEKNDESFQNKSSNNNSNSSKSVTDSQINNSTSVANNSEKENSESQKNKSTLNTNKANDIINNTKTNSPTVADNQTVKDEVNPEDQEKNKVPSIEDILNESKKIIEKEKRLNRWSVTPNAAPVYFNTLRDGSSIDGQFNNNTKTAETNMSYGISASYAVNRKLSIRSGINKVNLGYNTNNVVVFETLSKSSSSSILADVSTVKNPSKNTNTLDNVALVSADNFESNKAENLVSNSNTSINQSFAYIEVPLEIQYTLSDKKLGVNLIGGFSSFFLSDNELFSEVEGNRTSIGEATNINNVSYSANFGLGFQYKFTKKLNLNLEPMFKYQINTFNNTSGNFTPYFIGVYTGIGFKF